MKKIRGFSEKELAVGDFTSGKLVNVSRFGKVHLKSDFNLGFILNGRRLHFLYCFFLDQPPIQKISKKIEIGSLGKKNFERKFIFYVENDDENTVDFNVRL